MSKYIWLIKASQKHLCFCFVPQLYSCAGESRVSSAGPEEQFRHGGAAPSAGSEAEGQEAKHQEHKEKTQSCQAPQTVSPDGSTQTQPDQDVQTSARPETRRAHPGVNNPQGQSVQYEIDK